MTALVLLTPPAIEPLTLSEAKAHLRLDGSNEDALISNLIVAARQMCEEMTGRSLIQQSWRLWLDANPPALIVLPRPPLLSIAQVNVFAEDDTSSLVSAADYFVDTQSQPARIALKSGAQWGRSVRAQNGLRIDYLAGYGAAASAVPMALRQAMLGQIAHLFEQRGDAAAAALPPSVAALYQAYRLPRLL